MITLIVAPPRQNIDFYNLIQIRQPAAARKNRRNTGRQPTQNDKDHGFHIHT
jgi:hypothetical protein